MLTARATDISQPSSSAEPSYDSMWMELEPGTTGFSFSVWAPEEAYLLLAENYDNRDVALEVALGTEGRCSVQKVDARYRR